MNFPESLDLIMLLLAFVNMILFVVFSGVTVRRLRKHPEVREFLGVSFISGWDIINVICALSRPKWFSEAMRKSPTNKYLAADERPLYKYTHLAERVLSRLIFWLTVAVVFWAVFLL